MEPIRHGDIMFMPVSSLPSGGTEEKKTSYVVAEGETTGHKHTLVADRLFTVKTINNERYLVFDFPATISHQEHKPLEFTPGIYKIEQEQERDWFSLANRKVVD